MAKNKSKAKPKKTAKSTLAALPSRHLNYAPGSYLETTSRPLYALLFLLPLVVIYEIGTLLVNTRQFENFVVQERVATFTWLIHLARWSGLDPRLVWAFPGLVIIIILLCWHLASSYDWTIRVPRLGWMSVESIVLALPLLLLSAAIGGSSTTAYQSIAANNDAGSYSLVSHLITSIGAGIYEELIFRLILIGLLIMFMEDVCKAKSNAAIIVAIVVSSALFAAHHHIGIDAGGSVLLEPFEWGRFIFRSLAGVYLALIFSWRGYGIVAGAHAAYDIILKILW